MQKNNNTGLTGEQRDKPTDETAPGNVTPEDTSSEAAVKRGQDAINADQRLSPTPEKEQAEDAKQWRNEG